MRRLVDAVYFRFIFQLKAEKMDVGVNYMALDDERRRQELLLRELREIEREIASPSPRNPRLFSLASAVGVSDAFLGI